MLSFLCSYNLLHRVNCPVIVVYQVTTVFIYIARAVQLKYDHYDP